MAHEIIDIFHNKRETQKQLKYTCRSIYYQQID